MQVIDPRERAITHNDQGFGVVWEADNRKEQRWLWGAMELDLCDLPVDEYMNNPFIPKPSEIIDVDATLCLKGDDLVIELSEAIDSVVDVTVLVKELDGDLTEVSITIQPGETTGVVYKALEDGIKLISKEETKIYKVYTSDRSVNLIPIKNIVFPSYQITFVVDGKVESEQNVETGNIINIPTIKDKCDKTWTYRLHLEGWNPEITEETRAKESCEYTGITSETYLEYDVTFYYTTSELVDEKYVIHTGNTLDISAKTKNDVETIEFTGVKRYEDETYIYELDHFDYDYIAPDTEAFRGKAIAKPIYNSIDKSDDLLYYGSLNCYEIENNIINL